MKLHLPSSFRKALLACLASLAVSAFSVTVSTGSALIGGTALISFLAGQQAAAEDDDDEWHPYASVSADASWDANWGTEIDTEPSSDQLVQKALTRDENAITLLESASFPDSVLSLSAADSGYVVDGQAYILLDRGFDDTSFATVAGGKIYQADDAADTLSVDTYIYLAPEEEGQHFHMLVGGSISVEASSEQHHFSGKTHIQMDGGSVDYIVGGNHVTNAPMSFSGKSFISVFDGEVRGGIVGGSVITQATDAATPTDFDGSSSIFIYTALGNDDAAPGISHGGEQKWVLNAVIGGNVWLSGDNATAASASYVGKSSVMIDLVSEDVREVERDFGGDTEAWLAYNESRHGIFEKNIVAGNYLCFNNQSVSGSFSYEGNASISIKADTARDSFTGAIVGAGMVDTSIPGEFASSFSGSVELNIEGGEYTAPVVAGFMYDSNADRGESFQGELSGSFVTNIADGELSGGIIGGSWLHSSSKDALITYAPGATTAVNITGGAVTEGIVTGGNYVNVAQGSTRSNISSTAASSSVSVSHARLGDAASKTPVLVVGADYLRSGVSETYMSSVDIGEGASVYGSVVGGSYSYRNACVTVDSSKVTISGGEVTAADRIEAAVVGGVVMDILDGSVTQFSVQNANVALQGGSIEGDVLAGYYVSGMVGGIRGSVENAVISVTGDAYVKGDLLGYKGKTEFLYINALTIELLSADAVVEGNISALTNSAASESATVNLISGTLKGDVKISATQDTRLNIGADIDLALAEGSRMIVGNVVGDSSDQSTRSLLSFSSADSDYANLAAQAGSLSLYGFSAVENDGDVDLASLGVSFMTDALSDTFTKRGSGDLTLSGILLQYAEQNMGNPYRGCIRIEDGSLILVGATGDQQDLSGGLSFDMTGRVAGNADAAYLRGEGGLSFTVDRSVEVKFTKDIGGISAGRYYLVSGISADDFHADDWESASLDNLLVEGYEGKFKWVGGEDGLGSVVLEVSHQTDEKFYWGGFNGSDTEEENNWNTTSSGAPNGDDVYFDNGALNQNPRFSRTMNVGNIYILGGDYIFENKGNGLGFRQDETKDTRLIVGGEQDTAKARFEGANTRINAIDLRDNGTLTLAHENAINDGVTTIYFNGGTLMLTEAYSENGGLIKDISWQVKKADPSMGQGGQVRIGIEESLSRVLTSAIFGTKTLGGDTVFAHIGASEEEVHYNALLDQINKEGIVKLGDGCLVIKWEETEDGQTRFSAPISVEAGLLDFSLESAHEVTIGAAGTAIEIADGAMFRFTAKKGSTVSIVCSFSATGSGENAMAVLIGEGDYMLKSDNSLFSGTLALLGSGSYTAASSEVLGSSVTTLSLDCSELVFAETVPESVIRAGKLIAEGGDPVAIGGSIANDENREITIESALSGAGALGAASGMHHTITGSLENFAEGALYAAQDAEWLLGASDGSTSAPASGVIGTSFVGDGTLKFIYSSSSLLYTGAVTGNASLENSMKGSLTIGGDASHATGALIFRGNEIRLGDADHEASWGGNELTGSSGLFTLVSGSLMQSITEAGKGAVSLKVETAERRDAQFEYAGGTAVNAGGTASSLIESVTINRGGFLTGVSGAFTVGSEAGQIQMKLVLDSVNTKAGSGMIDADVSVPDQKGLTLDLSAEALKDVLLNSRRGHTSSYLELVTKGHSFVFADEMLDADSYLRTMEVIWEKGGYGQLLASLGYRAQSTSTGLALNGTSEDVYLVLNDNNSNSHTVDEFGQLDDYKATVVDKNQDFDIDLTNAETKQQAKREKLQSDQELIENELAQLDPTAPDYQAKAAALQEQLAEVQERLNRVNDRELWVDNLVGLDGSELHAEADPDSGVTIVFNNENPRAQDDYAKPDGVDYDGIDTQFQGSITGEYVDFKKTGSGTLTVGNGSEKGGMNVTDGDVILEEGGLELQGQNQLEDFVFNYGEDVAEDDKKGLTVRYGDAEVEHILEHGGADGSEGGDIFLEDGGSLTLTGENDLSDTHFKSDSGAGELIIEGADAELYLSGDASIENVDVSVKDGSLSLADDASLAANDLCLGEDGTLDLGNTTDNTAGSLSGSGTLTADNGALTITDDENDAVFSGSLKGSGSLSVAEGASFTLRDVDTSASPGGWNVSNSGSLTIDLSESRKDMKFGDIVLESDSDTMIVINTDVKNPSELHGGLLTVEDGANITLEFVAGSIYTGGDLMVGYFNAVDDASRRNFEDGLELEGLFSLRYEVDSVAYDPDTHELTVKMKQTAQNKFALPGMEKNAQAGADLFWGATDPFSAAWQQIITNPNLDMAKFMTGALMALENGDHAGLSKMLAAGAGASISTLGPALMQDMQRQLSSIRNRTTTMSMEPCPTTGRRCYHMWMNAENAYHKMDAESLAPGYSLNSWGGTVGMDVDLRERTTVGFALSAMYGKLKPESADQADGHMDTTYLNGFARMVRGAWIHSFVVSAGVADITMNRIVNYGQDSYSTKGETKGYALGALYEVGYSKVLNKEGTMVLQPIFNVEIRHAQIDGYTETGSDAGLKVGEITQNMMTFGLGTRFQGIVGENAYNRASIFEARALVKVDAGDRSGKVNNALICGDGIVRELESAEVGAVGLEIGAGLTIPVSNTKGSIFMDGTVEMRKGYSSMNATMGYRLNF